MKKLLALLLVLAMMTAMFAACATTECTTHVDADRNGACDNCGKEVPILCGDQHTDADRDGKCDNCDAAVPIPCDQHVDEDINNICDSCGAKLTNDLTKVLGLKLMKAVKGQLEAAQSMKLTFEYGYTTKVNIDEENPNGVNYAELKTVFTVWVTKTETGADAKVHALTKERLSADGEFTVTQDQVVLYLVDEVAYIYNEYENAYEVDAAGDAAISLTKQVPDMLTALANGYALSDGELEEMGAAFVTAFNIANNKGSLTLDAKPIFDSVQAKILSYDPETVTIREILDDVLSLIDPELNCAVIVDELSRIASLSLEDAMAELDAWLTEEYDTTIQGVYDTLLANEQVKTLLFQLMVGTEDSTPEMEAEFEEMYASWQEIKIAEMIPTEMKSVTLYDLIFTGFMPWEDGDANDPNSVPQQSYIPLETTVAQLNQILDTTATDFETLFGMEGLVDMIRRMQMIVEGIEVNALEAKIDMDFDALYRLEALTVTGTLDWECGFFGAYMPEPDDESNRAEPLSTDAEEEFAMDDHIVVTVALSVSELSEEALTITAPTNVVE